MAGRSVIVSAVRTPFGKLGGGLANHEATELGALAIKAALERIGVAPDEPQDVIMGQVLQAGAGQMPARQAAVARLCNRLVETGNIQGVNFQCDLFGLRDQLGVRAARLHPQIAVRAASAGSDLWYSEHHRSRGQLYRLGSNHRAGRRLFGQQGEYKGFVYFGYPYVSSSIYVEAGNLFRNMATQAALTKSKSK